MWCGKEFYIYCPQVKICPVHSFDTVGENMCHRLVVSTVTMNPPPETNITPPPPQVINIRFLINMLKHHHNHCYTIKNIKFCSQYVQQVCQAGQAMYDDFCSWRFIRIHQPEYMGLRLCCNTYFYRVCILRKAAC